MPLGITPSRAVLAAVTAVTAIGAYAPMAAADNSGTSNGGPPAFSGSANGVGVVHCKAFGQGNGVIVHHPDGTDTGGGCH